jgi:hypothetical protein
MTPASDQWWTYLASYDAGPGSTLVDLGLRKHAPLVDYPYRVVTGTTYVSVDRDGFPENADFDRLNDLQDRVEAAIAKQSPHIYAGRFTHNFEQTHYVYVKSGVGVEQALLEVYRGFCPGCKTYTKITHDPAWSAYFEFLFPNQATREHYGLRLE